MKTIIAIVAAAALFGGLAATSASAQEVISNPGYCAQFYPNANCQNKGPGNPYTDRAYRSGGWKNGYAMQRSGRGHHAQRHYRHRHTHSRM